MEECSYYLFINIFCLLLHSLILYKLFIGQDKQRSQYLFSTLLIVSCLSMLCDIMCCIMKYNLIESTKTQNYVFRSIFYILVSLQALVWFFYSEYIQKSKTCQIRIYQIFATIPFTVLCLLITASYFNNCIFYIDDDFVIRKGPLFLVYFLLSFGYIVFTTITALYKSLQPENYAYKKNYFTLAVFPVFPTLACIGQLFFVNMPLLSMGITLAVVHLYISIIETQILIDPLTNTNNRGALVKYLQRRLDDFSSDNLTVIILDIDFFKSVNDNYGHVEGDMALTRVSSALKTACHKRPCFISRYGGDEFVIVYSSANDSEIKTFLQDIHKEIDTINQIYNTPYKLSLSVGYACRDSSMKTVMDIINKADEFLYIDKKSRKNHPSTWK